MRKKKKENPFLCPSSWAEVDLGAIRHNLRQIQKICVRPGLRSTQVLAVVKADAYGHGMIKVACLLQKEGVGFFGVSSVGEGIALRQGGIRESILLFESMLSSKAQEIIRYRLTPTVCTLPFARRLNDAAKAQKKIVDIHVKVDTGMGRLGVWHAEAVDFIKKLNTLKYLSIKGIYTHFPSADTDRKFTKGQIDKLYKVIKELDQLALVVPWIHAANSMGLAGYKARVLNLARLGLMLYGLYPSPQIKRKIKLKPALKVQTKVIFVKKISKGRSISYGRTFIAKKSMTVATLSIGYNDGYFRLFSNKASVLIAGKRCPVLGNVTMNQIVVDVSKVPNVKPGMDAIILGGRGTKNITADELSAYAKTINYEIVCSLGNRLPRYYK